MTGVATSPKTIPSAKSIPPGPRSAAATGARWIRNPVDLLESCRSRFGDAFTLEFPGAGENVFISDPATIKEIFARDRRGNGMPSSRDLLLKPVMGERSVLLLEGEEHMRIRKLMLPPRGRSGRGSRCTRRCRRSRSR
jgi:cytochrome P450